MKKTQKEDGPKFNGVPPTNREVRRAATALERVTALEQGLASFGVQVDRAVSDLNDRLQTLEEVMSAIAGVVGEKEVAARLDQNRKAADAEKVARDAQGVVELLEKGLIKSGTEADENTIVVGTERSKDGTILRPGKLTLPFKAYSVEFQPTLKGKKAGDKLETPNGNSFEVEAVYQIVPEAERPKPKLEVIEGGKGDDPTETVEA